MGTSMHPSASAGLTKHIREKTPVIGLAVDCIGEKIKCGCKVSAKPGTGDAQTSINRQVRPRVKLTRLITALESLPARKPELMNIFRFLGELLRSHLDPNRDGAR
jgi:hypothetical protein